MHYSFEAMTAKERKQEIEQFIDFLKENKLYHPLESDETIDKMHAVWRIKEYEIQGMHEDAAGIDI
jgi:hypothetical protein